MVELRVLVVDDDHDHAESLARLVKSFGAGARFECDGVLGLMAAEEYLPQLAFLDLGMPTVNGLRLAKQFRSLDALRATRLIAVSGFADIAHRTLAIEAGFDDFLAKPYSGVEVQTILERVGSLARTQNNQAAATDGQRDTVKRSQATPPADGDGDGDGARSPAIHVGKTYWVRWAGEDFLVLVRGRGIAQTQHWVGSRLDTNRPIVLPVTAFQRPVE